MSLRVNPFRFVPFSRKQKRLLTFWLPGSPHEEADMVIADGAVRSGKTIALIDSFVTWSLFAFQGEAFIIAGKTIGALKRNVLKPMFEILTAKGIPFRYHRADSTIEIGTNIYYCFDAHNEASQDKLQGLTAAGALCDEIALFPESFVNQLIARCSIEGSKVFVSCNPQGPFHFFKTKFIDQAKEKNILYLHFTMEDNPALSPKIKERYERMYQGVFYRRSVLGLWTLAEGLVYPGFSEAHLIEEAELPPLTSYYVTSDFGITNPQVYLKVGFARVNGKPHAYFLDEYYHDSKKSGQKTTLDYSKDLKDFIGETPVRKVIVDPSASALKAQLRQDGFANLQDADNAVLEGINNFSTWLSEGRIHILKEKCPNLVKEFGTYSWDEKAGERGEDAPLKVHDHALDAARYLIQTLYPIQNSITFLA